MDASAAIIVGKSFQTGQSMAETTLIGGVPCDAVNSFRTVSSAQKPGSPAARHLSRGGRNGPVLQKSSVNVDVAEELPFLVSKLWPNYARKEVMK